MESGPLGSAIVESFDDMSRQLQTAARFVLEHPRDVALLSTREQARRAGVQPATMTRFAKRLGFSGYEAVRSLYADAVRNGRLGFSGKASDQATKQKLKGEKALAADILAAFDKQVATLGTPAVLERFAEAATRIAGARRVYCLGLRSSHVVSQHLHYVLSLVGRDVVLLDSMAALGADPLCDAGKRDVLVAISVLPYTRATVEIARYAARQGVSVVAITDSEVSPLAKLTKSAILVMTAGPSFFHSMAGAFVAAEVLAALVAGRGGKATFEALRRLERQLVDLKVHLRPRAVD